MMFKNSDFPSPPKMEARVWQNMPCMYVSHLKDLDQLRSLEPPWTKSSIGRVQALCGQSLLVWLAVEWK